MTPTMRAKTMTNAVRATPASILASTTRIRRGSRVKVVIAVRWLHSLVTSMMPSSGRKTDEMKADTATKSPNDASL